MSQAKEPTLDTVHKKDKREERRRRIERMQKYTSDGLLLSESEDSSSEERSVDSGRKPSPSSPPSLWRKNKIPDSKFSPLKSVPKTLEDSKHQPELQSPFRKTLEIGILSPERLRNPSDQPLDSVRKVISFDATNRDLVEDICDELTVASRCAAVLYDFLYQDDAVSSNRRWDDADSDDENNYDDKHIDKISPVDRMWFTGTFLNIVRNSAVGKKCVDDLVLVLLKLPSPSLHGLFGLITIDFVVQKFFIESTLFISSLIEDMVYEDDRVTSMRLPLLHKIYLASRLSMVEKVHIRKSILSASYNTSYARLQRCVAGEKMSRLNEVDLNNLANQNLLDCIANNIMDAMQSSLTAINSAKVTSKPNATEENAGVRVHDNISSIIQLTKFILYIEAKENDRMEISQRIDYLTRLVINMYRCYGSNLGASNAAVESPALQANLSSLLNQLVRSISSTDRPDSHKNDILRELLRYWPKGSYVREIAFIDATITVLCSMRPQSLSVPERIYSNAENASSLQFPVIVSYAERALNRLLLSCNSPHFKVANRAILAFQCPAILQIYIIENDQDDERVSESKARIMEKLVKSLRSIRSHWHPMVQQSASMTYDYIFEFFA